MATIHQGLEGRIADILNAREVVITLGEAHGIKRGMKFAILTDPLEVKDPETGEFLDVLVREKTRVEAVDVRLRITVCKTYRWFAANNPYDDTSESIQESLSVQTEAWKSPLAAEYVKVGDRVVLLPPEEQ